MSATWGMLAAACLAAPAGKGPAKADPLPKAQAHWEEIGAWLEKVGETESGKDLQKLAHGSKEALEAWGAKALVAMTPETWERMLPAVKKLRKSWQTGIKLRKWLAAAQDGPAFYKKGVRELVPEQYREQDYEQVLGALGMVGIAPKLPRWMEFKGLTDDDFEDGRREALGDLGWDVEVERKEGRILWSDPFLGRRMTVKTSGRVDDEQDENNLDDMLKRMLLKVRPDGEGVQKSFLDGLGLEVRALEDEERVAMNPVPAAGVLVKRVAESSQGEEAGVKPGDVVLKAGEKSLEDSRDFQKAVERVKPGKTLVLTVLRKGRAKPEAMKFVNEDLEPEPDVPQPQQNAPAPDNE